MEYHTKSNMVFWGGTFLPWYNVPRYTMVYHGKLYHVCALRRETQTRVRFRHLYFAHF